MEQQAQLMKEWVSELNELVEELDVLAELPCKQLNIHLSFKSRVPSVFHEAQPLLADCSRPEQLPGS